MYLRARFYESSTGRFISRDTGPGKINRPASFNAWNYVEANPINARDPLGLCANCFVFYFTGVGINGDANGDGDLTNDNLNPNEKLFFDILKDRTQANVIMIYPYGAGTVDPEYSGQIHYPSDILRLVLRAIGKGINSPNLPPISLSNAPVVLSAAYNSSPVPEAKADEIFQQCAANNEIDQDNIKIDFIGSSGGGQIAYSSAVSLKGRLMVDNLVLIGSPFRAHSGMSNIRKLWEIIGGDDPYTGPGGIYERPDAWDRWNRGYRSEWTTTPYISYPPYNTWGMSYMGEVYHKELDIYSNGATQCQLAVGGSHFGYFDPNASYSGITCGGLEYGYLPQSRLSGLLEHLINVIGIGREK